jgi:FtsP/CotA-like multicopper oxidase with cupredoxin domain
MWHPDGDSAPGALVPAFAEQGRALQIPGPLLRVPAGTEVVVTLASSLPDGLLTVHGLASRPAAPGSTSDSVQVPAGTSREVRFRLDSAGTYYYWGTTSGRRFGMRTGEDAQLSGAIVVDPPHDTPPRDRILVIGQWSDTAASEFLPAERMRRALFVVNGRSWPRTPRLRYVVGDTVRWRVINTSADVHPMHLHGFYYRVDSRGDGTVDTTYDEARRDHVATERMRVGSTMSLTWVPERAGNWLFHCHVTAHFSRRGSLGIRTEEPATDPRVLHTSNHALEGMGGLVVGVAVAPRRTEAHARSRDDDGDARRLRLLVRPAVGSTQARPLYAFSLQEGGAEPAPVLGARSGPVIALTRGRPVAITVVNRLPEPTAVHWHGIELESYFDGVAGFSGVNGRLTPSIAPGDSFVARFTPPRAGTFIYHTHVNETRQQPAGLSGPLVVMEPGTRFDAATDIPVLITSPPDSADETHAVLLNGRLAPDTLEMRAGTRYRLRLINITTARPNLRMELRRDTSLVKWRRIAKDGADLPVGQQVARAAQELVSVGETVDVELTPPAPGAYRLEARTASGRLLATMPLRASEATDSRRP